MSVYATIATSDDLSDYAEWMISVAVFDNGHPIRVNHGDASWFIPTADVRRIMRALKRAEIGDTDAGS